MFTVALLTIAKNESNLGAHHRWIDKDVVYRYSKLGKEYIKAVYCHPAYWTYMQSTS